MTGRSFLVVLSCAFGTGSLSVPLAIANDPISLKLTVALDRDSYLHRECVFVDWNLTNEGKLPVSLVNAGYHSLGFTLENEKGKPTQLDSHSTHCFGKPIIRVLKPGESLHGWLEVRDGYSGWSRLGKYTLKTTFLALVPHGDEDGFRTVVSSEAVTFTVVKPAGDDLTALEMVDKFLEQRRGPNPELDDDEYQSGLFFADLALQNALISQTKSARYRALAQLYRGMRSMPSADEKVRPSVLSVLTIPQESFTACANSEGSSKYMKGLARYYLLRLKLQEEGATTKQEVSRMASGLIRDYPKTSMAFEAQKILDELQGRKK